MKSTTTIAAVLSVVLLGGCASVEVSRPQATQGTDAFKVYPPKPYLLVARAGEDGKVISVTPLMLPDQKDPHFVRAKAGLGTADLKFEIDGGILKSVGVTTDSKIPELLKEIGGIATSFGTLQESLATARKTNAEARKEAADTETIQLAAKKAHSAAATVSKIKAPGAAYSLSAEQEAALSAIELALENVGTSLDNPRLDHDQATLDQYAKQLTSAADDFAKLVTQLPSAVSKSQPVASVTAEANAAAGLIASKAETVPVFDLYEVNNENGATTLTRVVLPKL